MKLVVGLGNPGPRYAATRHNAGFRIAEGFARSQGIALAAGRFGGRFGSGPLQGGDPAQGPAPQVGVLAPETFMNRSGEAVAEALRELPVDDPAADLLLLLDDADLPFGRLRLRPAGGSGGHRGLAHVLECLGRRDLPRLRFGVGRPPEGVETADYVLTRFTPEEEARLPEQIDAAVRAVGVALREGLPPAMNAFNRDPEPD